jgi:hypothetical protein
MAKPKAKVSKVPKKQVENQENEAHADEAVAEHEGTYAAAAEETKPVTEFSIGDIEVSINGADPFGMERGDSEDVINISEYEEVEDNPKQKTKVVVANNDDDPLSTNTSDRDDFLPEAQASIDEEDRRWE